MPHLSPIAAQLGLAENDLDFYGTDKAKLTWPVLQKLAAAPARGQLILVTAISPTPAGEGKTTTSIGLGDALASLGESVAICLREPSLGPCFGVKGGATGGGQAQLTPMEDINLHFTGDLHAITAAHNLLAALVDNHIFQGNALGLVPEKVTWRRVLDVNDRALRDVRVAVGQAGERATHFDITAASEIMAIVCLAANLADLRRRLGQIRVGVNATGAPVTAAELGAVGALAVLLRDALRPNLVQTLAGTPAFVHGGPFANLAHGCNSLLATQTALKIADWVVTEAGFGADLGAEKFLDLKCRKGGLWPAAAVLVATVRALKFHGGVPVAELNTENLAALETGFANLERHLHNLQKEFGLPVVVAVNQFASDTAAELAWLRTKVESLGAAVAVCRHFAEGAAGARELAEKVRAVARVNTPQFLYADTLPLTQKIEVVATRLYGAAAVTFSPEAAKDLAAWQKTHGHLPVCIAKTQMSFATDANLKGAPSGHTLHVREVRLSAGAEFVVAVAGDLLTMPALPAVPAALGMDLTDDGEIVGLR